MMFTLIPIAAHFISNTTKILYHVISLVIMFGASLNGSEMSWSGFQRVWEVAVSR